MEQIPSGFDYTILERGTAFLICLPPCSYTVITQVLWNLSCIVYLSPATPNGEELE